MARKLSTDKKKKRSSVSSNGAVKSTKLYVALETIRTSKNSGVTPTLRRLAACAIRKLLRMNG